MTAAKYRAERIKRKLSQKALGELVGVSRVCICNREAGRDRYPITVEAWLAICSLPIPV
jgi:DNA-binding XRE family transcriptional regulator